jgi:hypothetical protein
LLGVFFYLEDSGDDPPKCLLTYNGLHEVIFQKREFFITTAGRVKNFLLPTLSRPALGPTQSPVNWVLGDLSPGVRWPWHEADHSSPTSAEVKKMWIYTPTPPYVFMA